jgi:heme A synthase
MSGTAAAPEALEDSRTRQFGRLRGWSMGAMVILILQYALGMGVNLFITTGKGGFSEAFKNGPVLALHTILGLLLVLVAIVLLVQAITARHPAAITASAVGLAAIIGAAGSGISFLKSGTNGASMGMAMATAVAFLCYTLCLFLLGSHGNRRT